MYAIILRVNIFVNGKFIFSCEKMTDIIISELI